jgi:ATP-dependent Clp protease ATP-binding subunit ClpA
VRLACWLAASQPKIDPEALAALGIDLETVRERLEETFGPGALERTPACLGICPRLKMALAYAVDHADEDPVTDQHILLGMLSVPDCVAARVLTERDVR